MTERRKIGGITKETFLALVEKSGGDVELEALKFDMRQCIVGKIDMLRRDFNEHPAACEDRFVKSFIGIGDKVALSVFDFIVVLLLIGLMVGLGILELTDVIDLKRLL